MFGDITPYTRLKVNRSFEGTCGLHLQELRISQTGNLREVGSHAGLSGLFFYPDDGGDMLLRNVGSLPTDYKALYPTRQEGLFITSAVRTSGPTTEENIGFLK
jgi:hypothetical protein